MENPNNPHTVNAWRLQKTDLPAIDERLATLHCEPAGFQAIFEGAAQGANGAFFDASLKYSASPIEYFLLDVHGMNSASTKSSPSAFCELYVAELCSALSITEKASWAPIKAFLITRL